MARLAAVPAPGLRPHRSSRQISLRHDATLAIALIAAGTLWLLYSLGWVPDVRWVAGWTLIGSGVLILFFDGITRKSVVGGPLLIILGLLWFAHLEWRSPASVLAPIAMIALGLLLLFARLPFIPEARARRDAEGASPPSEPGAGPRR